MPILQGHLKVIRLHDLLNKTVIVCVMFKMWSNSQQTDKVFSF